METKQIVELNIKSEVIKVLTPIFGEEIKKMLTEYYDSGNPNEILEVAYHMLTGYMDKKIADRVIARLLEKFPDVKMEVPSNE